VTKLADALKDTLLSALTGTGAPLEPPKPKSGQIEPTKNEQKPRFRDDEWDLFNFAVGAPPLPDLADAWKVASTETAQPYWHFSLGAAPGEQTLAVPKSADLNCLLNAGKKNGAGPRVSPIGSFRRITGLSCWSNVARHRNTVCESITWADPVVTFERREVTLPLTNEFRCATWFSRNRAGARIHPLWPLPAELDVGFQHLFAYELSKSKPVKPLGIDGLPDLDLSRTARAGGSGRVSNGQKTVWVGPPCAIVCVGLVCCRRSDDFQPLWFENWPKPSHWTNPAWVARFYPLVMVLANQPLSAVRSTITLTRPRKSQPCHPPKDCHDHNHEKEMTPDIRAGLYADDNDFTLANLFAGWPLWSRLFSHYIGDRVVGKRTERIPEREFVVVHRAESPGPIRGAIVRNEVKLGEVAPSPVEVRRCKRQGAFDNVHLAPAMIAPPAVLAATRGMDPEETLQNIVMAPICQHDCLHVHWRWGEGLGNGPAHSHLRGWAGGKPYARSGYDNSDDHDKDEVGWAGGKPYARSGAPMVPENQTVRIRVRDGRQLTYTAEATGAPPGKWQIFFHHGAAYVLALHPLADLGIGVLRMADWLNAIGSTSVARELLNEELWPGELRKPISWAMFYWRLQYLLKSGRVYHRLEYVGEEGKRKLWDEPNPLQAGGGNAQPLEPAARR
jgi:hypothetical protein